MDNREFFNNLADGWDNHTQHNEDKINLILDKLSIREGSSILDVGSGTGVLIPYLYSRTGKNGMITAIDISDRMIEIARDKYPYDNISYINGDVINYELSSYDFIICYSMFPHFNNKKYAVKRLSNLLNNRGKLVIAHSDSRYSINTRHKGLEGCHLPSADAISKYMLRAGLSVGEIIDNEEIFMIIGNKI